MKILISNQTKTVKVEEATASVTIGSLGNNITMKESDEENLDDDWLWRHKHSSTQAFTSFLVSKLAGAFVLFRLFFFIGLPFHISICTIVCVWFLKLYSVYLRVLKLTFVLANCIYLSIKNSMTLLLIKFFMWRKGIVQILFYSFFLLVVNYYHGFFHTPSPVS